MYIADMYRSRPLRGGGRGVVRELPLKIFFICRRLKVKYILFEKLYPNINISVLVYYRIVLSVGKHTGFLKYLPKNMALLIKKKSEKKNVKIRFRLFLDKQNLCPLSQRGGGS